MITKTGLLFSNLHTPIKKREGFFKERFTRDCGEPATWIVFPLKSPAIVILSDSRKRNDKVGFRGQCLSVRWAECPSHLGRQACVLSTLGQRLSCKEKAGKVNSQWGRGATYIELGPDLLGKNAFQMHSKHSSTIRLEKAGKSVWLLRGICLYIRIASSFSFISSGTWLPNECIDYLSQMHIAQLKAIKACKIAATSRPMSGF